MTPAPIRLAFVDDHPTLLRGLTTIFGDDPRYVVSATGTRAEEAVAVADGQVIDVVVIDLSMPGDVFGAIETIASMAYHPKVVVFTAYANVDLALKALEAGAHAFVLKGRPSDDLTEAIEAVLRGELYVSPDFSQRLFSGLRNSAKDGPAKPSHLSPRELQLVSGLLEGKTNREIANSLKLTEKTVKHYMTNLMNKLNVKNRLEVALTARSLGFEVPPLGPEDE
jgi:two-component system nitrate/nitrite response regulator NarL